MKLTLPTLLLTLGGVLQAADSPFLGNARQLIFSGRRSGEGYFSEDGKKLVFQSEREPGNPFYQIYVMDLETGDTNRVSPGHGKTTCAWIHPDGQRVMFASTHADEMSQDLQQAELKSRAEGKQKRYSWDYDPHYDLWECAMDGSGLKQLTTQWGYDAEGNYSPDGERIVFSSMRHIPRDAAPDKNRMEIQPQYYLDIYTMKRDGTDVKRLTDAPGYDGGPFWSADGKKICWRRFNEDETVAEIWTMNADGTDQKPLTKMGAMSWAPFFHPSGKYLIFTTNKHGFDNFELYLVDAAGAKEPVRVTDAEGFDGLPVFSPDGTKLSWTSNRTAEKQSQLFMADWNDAAAQKALGLDGAAAPAAVALAKPANHPGTEGLNPEITGPDLLRHVAYLASDELEGRGTGTKGEALATSYVSELFGTWGLQPAGDAGQWLHAFEFTAGVELGKGNALTVTGADAGPLKPEADWLPLTFSSTGTIDAGGKGAPVCFVGYGMEVPESVDGAGKKHAAYSSYFHLDVKDKWVLLLRYVPEGLSQEDRVRFARHSSLRYKALTARQKGARGIIVVSGPTSKVKDQLVPLVFDASLAGSGIAGISLTDAAAEALLKSSGKSLAALQADLDKGEPVQGFDLPGVALTAQIDIRQEKRTGHNVLGRLAAPGGSTEPALVIGAHIDHLGMNGGADSRADDKDRHAIHHGADDNASGIGGMLEIAQWMADQVKTGKLVLKRDVIFAGWSGEELGLLGSAEWCRKLAKDSGDENAKLTSKLCANLNMDMIGRLQKSVILQGLGSSDWWAAEIEKRNAVLGLPVQTQQDCFVNTDATTFYVRGVPILNAFTGPHEDYHKPSDTADKVDAPNAARIARFMALVARTLATTAEEPVWKEQKRPEEARSGMRVYLGTIPDYAQGDVEGVKLSGVAPGGPADKAGVQTGDVIVKLAGKDIKNIYDYTFILGALKVGEAADLEVKRGSELKTMKITPGSRD